MGKEEKIAKGDEHRAKGDYEKAIECYTEAGALEKILACIDEMKGDALKKAGAIEEAVRYYEACGAIHKLLDCLEDLRYFGKDEPLIKKIAEMDKEKLKEFGKKSQDIKLSLKCLYYAGDEEGLKEIEGRDIWKAIDFYKYVGYQEGIDRIIPLIRDELIKKYPEIGQATIDYLLDLYSRGELREIYSVIFQLKHLKKKGSFYQYGVS
ncbi:MAG: hypothetical protein QW585_02280 [Candidatus Pacearchaeota archaeon]